MPVPSKISRDLGSSYYNPTTEEEARDYNPGEPSQPTATTPTSTRTTRKMRVYDLAYSPSSSLSTPSPITKERLDAARSGSPTPSSHRNRENRAFNLNPGSSSTTGSNNLSNARAGNSPGSRSGFASTASNPSGANNQMSRSSGLELSQHLTQYPPHSSNFGFSTEEASLINNMIAGTPSFHRSLPVAYLEHETLPMQDPSNPFYVPNYAIEFDQIRFFRDTDNGQDRSMAKLNIHGGQDMFSTQDMASNQAMFATQDIASNQATFSTQDMSSNQDLFSTQDMTSTQDLFSAQDMNSTEDPFSAQDMNLTQDLFSTQDLASTQDPSSTQLLSSTQDPSSTQNLVSAQDLSPSQIAYLQVHSPKAVHFSENIWASDFNTYPSHSVVAPPPFNRFTFNQLVSLDAMMVRRKSENREYDPFDADIDAFKQSWGWKPSFSDFLAFALRHSNNPLFYTNYDSPADDQ